MAPQKGEGQYKNQIPIGKHMLWYENGQKKSEMQFANGRPHGLRIEWYENGYKKEEGNFVNGNQHGKWTYYNKDGSIDGIEEY